MFFFLCSSTTIHYHIRNISAFICLTKYSLTAVHCNGNARNRLWGNCPFFKMRIQNDELLPRMILRNGEEEGSRKFGTVIWSFRSLWDLFISLCATCQHPGCSCLCHWRSSCACNVRQRGEGKSTGVGVGMGWVESQSCGCLSLISSSIKWVY